MSDYRDPYGCSTIFLMEEAERDMKQLLKADDNFVCYRVRAELLAKSHRSLVEAIIQYRNEGEKACPKSVPPSGNRLATRFSSLAIKSKQYRKAASSYLRRVFSMKGKK